MVENVEEFETKIEGEILLDLGALQYAEVGVVESRAVEKPAVGSPECPWNAIQSECTHARQAGRCYLPRGLWCRKIWRRRDEVASRAVGGWAIRIRFPRIQDLHWTNPIRHIRGGATPQSVVTVGLVQLYRKTAGEAGDSLNLPALGQTLGGAGEQPVEGYRINVTGHKIVSDVRRRQATAQFRIYEVRQVAEPGGIVQGLGKSVSGQEGEVIGLAFDGDLPGIVNRIGARECERVAIAKTHLESRTWAVVWI